MRERKVLAIPPSWYVRFTAEIGIIYWSIYDRPTLKRGGGGVNVTISSFFRTVVIKSLIHAFVSFEGISSCEVLNLPRPQQLFKHSNILSSFLFCSFRFLDS